MSTHDASLVEQLGSRRLQDPPGSPTLQANLPAHPTSFGHQSMEEVQCF